MRIYLMGEEKIIEAFEGDGSNLTQEDIEAGYEDYVYYTMYDVSNLDEVTEEDGGMMLLTVPYEEAFSSSYKDKDGEHKFFDNEKLADAIVDFAYGRTEYIIL